jgi:myo-inositol-hexaphosphate 3-phosphohydrolase
LNDNRTGGHDYFIIAASEQKRGFRCDSIIAGEGIDGGVLRTRTVLAFAFKAKNSGLVVHDTDDELYMAKLCEMLWPGERIRVRKEVEAERAANRKAASESGFSIT